MRLSPPELYTFDYREIDFVFQKNFGYFSFNLPRNK